MWGSFLKEWQVREKAERKEEDYKKERKPDAFPLTLLFPVLTLRLFVFLFIYLRLELPAAN
jgi:hypothetical protein